LPIHDKAFSVINDLGQSVENTGAVTLYVSGQQPDEVSAKLTGRHCLNIKVR
ncbi:MAG: hypothetical protein GX171_08640, partial [Clostridiales bacterium]|nr:hypothetical protein [Clostridiales bacterium]